MNRKRFLQLSGVLLPIPFLGCVSKTGQEVAGDNSRSIEKFSFAFLTDVHLGPDNYGDGDNGLRQALADAKKRNVDFVLFGGDNIGTAHYKKEEQQVADSLHEHFKSIVSEFSLPSYFTIGNHDRYFYCDGEEDRFGFKLFERHYGPVYHSFDHKGVHFIVLNSMDRDGDKYCHIGPEQMDWLRKDLEAVGKEMPIVVSLHVPLLSLYYPVVDGTFGFENVGNTKQVVDLLNQYNLKVVLQGHQHIHEEIMERNRWFVTGGGVSACWWQGPMQETEEGYLLVHVGKDDSFTWEYIDYGWEAKITPKK
ncbi:metallophosphoesterase [Parabacteroides sp. W1-Q-101]|uniref:metallophosphoesterase family protein n=1 Tax=Parabacteroides caeci TaxID=2949650 RepID=UPI00202F3879|nr:metallophosphoesterase [Parabacteroides sp. W1-Q-101]MCM0718613.1 metallophosphoesterase [Parabacteroides sp. W1-Q-101]